MPPPFLKASTPPRQKGEPAGPEGLGVGGLGGVAAGVGGAAAGLGGLEVVGEGAGGGEMGDGGAGGGAEDWEDRERGRVSWAEFSRRQERGSGDRDRRGRDRSGRDRSDRDTGRDRDGRHNDRGRDRGRDPDRDRDRGHDRERERSRDRSSNREKRRERGREDRDRDGKDRGRDRIDRDFPTATVNISGRGRGRSDCGRDRDRDRSQDRHRHDKDHERYRDRRRELARQSDDLKNFSRQVQEVRLQSSRPGGSGEPPQGAVGRSGFKAPTLRPGMPRLPTKSEKVCSSLRSHLRRLNSLRKGTDTIPGIKKASQEKTGLALLAALNECLSNGQPPEIPSNIEPSNLVIDPEMLANLDTKVYGNQNPRQRKFLNPVRGNLRPAKPAAIPLECAEHGKEKVRIEPKKDYAALLWPLKSHKLAPLAGGSGSPVIVEFPPITDHIQTEAEPCDSGNDSDLSWSACMTMTQKEAVEAKRKAEEDRKARDLLAREEARLAQEKKRAKERELTAAMQERKRQLLEKPESGDWDIFGANQERKGPYSFQEVRERVRSGKLPGGASVIRREDGLMLPASVSEVLPQNVQFSDAFRQHCDALQVDAEQIYAPEELVNSIFERARKASDFLKKCSPLKLDELKKWVDLTASQLPEGFQDLIKDKKSLYAHALKPDFEREHWTWRDLCDSDPGAGESAPVQYTARVAHELHKTIMQSMKKRINQEIHGAVAQMFSRTASGQKGEGLAEEDRGWNLKKRAY